MIVCCFVFSVFITVGQLVCIRDSFCVCSHGCWYYCNWLPGKTHLQNDPLIMYRVGHYTSTREEQMAWSTSWWFWSSYYRRLEARDSSWSCCCGDAIRPLPDTGTRSWWLWRRWWLDIKLYSPLSKSLFLLMSVSGLSFHIQFAIRISYLHEIAMIFSAFENRLRAGLV